MGYEFIVMDKLDRESLSNYQIVATWKNGKSIIDKGERKIEKTPDTKREYLRLLKLLSKYGNTTKNQKIKHQLTGKLYGEIKPWGHRIFFFQSSEHFCPFPIRGKKKTKKTISRNYEKY